MHIFKHYFNRTLFDKTAILFAVALPVAIIFIMYFVNMATMPEEVINEFMADGRNAFSSILITQLVMMFALFSGASSTHFFYKDLKNDGVRDRLLSAPIKKNTYIISIISSTVTFAIVTSIASVTITGITLNAHFTNLILLFLVILAFSILGVFLNLLNFYLWKKENVTNIVSQILIWILSIIGGLFGNLENFTPSLLRIIMATPVSLGRNAIVYESYLQLGILTIWILALAGICLILGRRNPI